MTKQVFLQIMENAIYGGALRLCLVGGYPYIQTLVPVSF